MNRKNATRKALVLSVISLLLCCTMLVGTTFAWFTDSVTSGLNTITAGNLDVELEYSKDTTTWKSVQNTTDLFSGALWEPGHTEVVYLRLTNKGTLALNYQLGINVKSETPAKNVEDKEFKLSDYIQFGVVEGQSTAFTSRAAAVAAVTNGKPLNAGYTKASAMTAQNDTAYLALVVYMPESVGNEANYRGTAPQIELGINVVATQKTQESDSFGTDYDVLAQGGYAQSTLPANATYVEIDVYAGDSNVKAASFLIPKEMIVEPEKPIEITIVPTAQDPSVTVTDAQDARSYDITVSNIQEANGEAIKVQLNVGMGLSGVKLYHRDQLVPGATYDPNTGYVKFETTSFSPYTVVHDAVSKPTTPPSESDLPVAVVTRAPQHENVKLPWESYGQWSPTEGLEANLEAAYIFTCQDTAEEAKASPYADWYCDFVVKLDKDLGANEIFLGGNYGSFGWVGFHNGDLTLAANREIPLLGSVTSNPWTYADVASFVGTFTCGVGDVDDALAGATFTVMLRLTNPENENERYDVATINYTFPEATVSTLSELKAALDSGAKEIDAQGANLGDFYYDAVFTDGAVIKNAKFTNFYGGNVNGTVTFENCEFVSDHSYSANFDSGNGNIVFNNCLFDGWSSFGDAIKNVQMNNCTFKKTYNYGILRFYQDAQLNNCTFAANFEGVDTNVTGKTVTLTNCTGVEGKIYNNGSNKGVWVVNGVDISESVTSW